MSYTPPPPPPPGSEGFGYATPRTNQKAQWSMILGIVSVTCCGVGVVTGIAALVLGNSARKEIEASRGAQAGAGMAQAGVILGGIGIAISLLLLILLGTGAVTFDPGTPGF